MQLAHSLDELERGRPTILTIGAFDGVHRGHQYVIRQVVDRARRLDYDSAVLTFDPRPQVALRPGSTQLTDAFEKARILRALGPDLLIMLPFTTETAAISAGQFLVAMMEGMNLAEVWAGADFAFGHKREGTIDFLIRSGQKNGFAVHVVPRESLGDQPISSTAARERVASGNVAGAARLLGHYFALHGTVVTGAGRGADLGFPTANVQTSEYQLLPALGIYAAYLRRGGERLPAAVSVGRNPVFGGTEIVVEAYVLDFSSDLRGAEVSIDFVDRIRDEQNFDSVDALVAEMHRDVEKVRTVLAGAEEPGELLLQE